MSILSRLFGGGGGGGASAPEATAEEYKGFTITPMPVREGSGYRVSARIDKDVDGVARTHTLIRADVIEDLQAATEASAGKARQMIDEQGDRLFD